MKPHVRILLIIAIAALAAGWLALRRGNAELEKRLAARPTGTAEVAR